MSAGAPAARRSQPRSLRKYFLVLVVFALAVIYFMGLLTGQTPVFDSIARRLGYQSDFHYAVVIDAGSSGSRVLAYKFRVPFSVFGQVGLDLVEEHFQQSKPGLSSFADDPEKGADTIVSLIRSAERLVPAARRRGTPLLVRATAGLRLLPTDKSDRLIEHVQGAISKLGYDVAPNAVEVMEGSDEGIFIWYTINLLHGTMGAYDSMAALDLGGGSTQVTYRPRGAAGVPPADLFLVPASGNNITVYTHSYLNLGLLAARHGILRLEAGAARATATNFTSVCVDPIVQNEPWTYANKQYYVSGAARASGASEAAVAERCRALVRRYVLATLDWEPTAPPHGNVAAMSYYYDIAADAGIIDVMKGGAVRVQQYRAEALRTCSNSNVEQPWACLDLLYVTTLLHDAFKMDYEQNICLFKKVAGHEVSWALGLAYTTVLEHLQRLS